MALTDGSGHVANSYSYDPYGTQSGSGTAPDYYGFQDGVTEPGGLYHFGARLYDPQVGRWTQTDPIDQVGDVTQANPYTFGADDPVNEMDDTGTQGFHLSWSRGLAFVFSRWNTRWLQHNLAMIGATTGVIMKYVCPHLGELTGLCEAGGAILFGDVWNTLNNATRENECLGFEAGGEGIKPYIDSGGWCTNT